MKIGIVGSGIAGLSTAFYLSQHEGVEIEILERASVPGGRANVLDGAEHCARVFLDDYACLFGVLNRITRDDGRTVRETLVPMNRYSYTHSRGWVELSHLYTVFAREITPAERLRTFLERRRAPLLAEQEIGANENRYGSARNYSLPSILRMAANLLKSRRALTVPGRTDEWLIDPWVQHLERRGVTLRTDARVTGLSEEDEGVSVELAGASRSHFDAVVVTSFAPDTGDLLSASGVPHVPLNLPHTHCHVFTLALDPRERCLDGSPRLYSYDGVNVLLQPDASRCLVLCIRSPSTRTDFVVARAREYLELDHEFVDVRVRDNQRQDEAIYIGDYVDPRKLLGRPFRNLYFAGSYLRNRYAVDSGEGAARTALEVARRIAREHELGPTVGPPAAAGGLAASSA